MKKPSSFEYTIYLRPNALKDGLSIAKKNSKQRLELCKLIYLPKDELIISQDSFTKSIKLINPRIRQVLWYTRLEDNKDRDVDLLISLDYDKDIDGPCVRIYYDFYISEKGYSELEICRFPLFLENDGLGNMARSYGWEWTDQGILRDEVLVQWR